MTGREQVHSCGEGLDGWRGKQGYEIEQKKERKTHRHRNFLVTAGGRGWRVEEEGIGVINGENQDLT